jgi:hypothetical protein
VQDRNVKCGSVEQSAELLYENELNLTTRNVVSSSAEKSGFHRVDDKRISGRDVASERGLLPFRDLGQTK